MKQPRRGNQMKNAAAIFGAAAIFVATPGLADPGTISMTVKSRQIAGFKIGSSETRFGALEFAGGLEIWGGSRHFGALSAIHVSKEQSSFIGVTDTGFWYGGRILRDAEMRPAGLDAVTMLEIADRNGNTAHHKGDADAEGMTVDNDIAFVSFEREHRIVEYDISDPDNPVFLRQAKPPVPMHELRRNKGFETVAMAPSGTPFPGALVGVSERSLDRRGNVMGFVRMPGGASFEFSVKRRDDYDITDGKFLPDGDLLLLERRFNVQDGVAMRLRRIPANGIVAGATVDGDILLEADMRYQIDNMEGLAVTVDPDGAARLTLVSDDNHSILQRNLLLEFRLVGATTASISPQ